jgi:hypothetical protein
MTCGRQFSTRLCGIVLLPPCWGVSPSQPASGEQVTTAIEVHLDQHSSPRSLGMRRPSALSRDEVWTGDLCWIIELERLNFAFFSRRDKRIDPVAKANQVGMKLFRSV